MKLSYLGGDTLENETTYEVYEVSDGEGQPLCELKLEEQGGQVQTYTATAIFHQDVSSVVPQCMGQDHFVTSMVFAITNALTQDMDHFSDAFYDEDGKLIAIPFKLLELSA